MTKDDLSQHPRDHRIITEHQRKSVPTLAPAASRGWDAVSTNIHFVHPKLTPLYSMPTSWAKIQLRNSKIHIVLFRFEEGRKASHDYTQRAFLP